MLQNGKTLSMHNDAIYKGDVTHNGTLLKLHDNSYTIGYSALLTPNGKSAGTVKFGNGVFLNLAKKNNNVYAGAPTETGAIPAFGGIMVREPAVASSYPVLNDEVSGFQHGLLCREGYVVYKKGDVLLSGRVAYKDVELFDYVYQNYCLWINGITGKAYFSPKNTIFASKSDIFVGRVVEINPDDKSVTVYITPAIQSNTADIGGLIPIITVDNASITNTEIPFSIVLGTEGTIQLFYKAHTDDNYTAVEGTFAPVFDEVYDNYQVDYKLTGLTKNTAYDIMAHAITACGVATATKESVSTTNV